jgi:hypothetical protein
VSVERLLRSFPTSLLFALAKTMGYNLRGSICGACGVQHALLAQPLLLPGLFSLSRSSLLSCFFIVISSPMSHTINHYIVHCSKNILRGFVMHWAT